MFEFMKVKGGAIYECTHACFCAPAAPFPLSRTLLSSLFHSFARAFAPRLISSQPSHGFRGMSLSGRHGASYSGVDTSHRVYAATPKVSSRSASTSMSPCWYSWAFPAPLARSPSSRALLAYSLALAFWSPVSS